MHHTVSKEELETHLKDIRKPEPGKSIIETPAEDTKLIEEKLGLPLGSFGKSFLTVRGDLKACPNCGRKASFRHIERRHSNPRKGFYQGGCSRGARVRLQWWSTSPTQVLRMSTGISCSGAWVWLQWLLLWVGSLNHWFLSLYTTHCPRMESLIEVNWENASATVCRVMELTTIIKISDYENIDYHNPSL